MFIAMPLCLWLSKYGHMFLNWKMRRSGSGRALGSFLHVSADQYQLTLAITYHIKTR